MRRDDPAGMDRMREWLRLVSAELGLDPEAVLEHEEVLLAMVAAVALTLRKRKGLKSIPPSEQVAVKREGRIELVKMRAEKED